LRRRRHAAFFGPAAAGRRSISIGGGGALIFVGGGVSGKFHWKIFSFLYFLIHEKVFKCATKSTVTMQIHEDCHNGSVCQIQRAKSSKKLSSRVLSRCVSHI